MFAIVQNNTIVQLVPEGTAFELDGVQYPANWCNLSTPEEKTAIGMVDVIYGQAPSDTYYWVTQNAPALIDGQVVVTYTSTPKDLDQTKANCKSQINATAYSILFPSDWMVVKATETSTPIDPAWNTWRQSIRTTAASYVAAITGAADMPALEVVMSNITWPHDPDYVEPQQSTTP
jgi:hypothetical protein